MHVFCHRAQEKRRAFFRVSGGDNDSGDPWVFFLAVGCRIERYPAGRLAGMFYEFFVKGRGAMDAMSWIAVAIFAATIIAVIINVFDSTVASWP